MFINSGEGVMRVMAAPWRADRDRDLLGASVTQASTAGADLLVLPEFVLGHAAVPADWPDAAEASDGPAALDLAQRAQAAQLAIMAGHVERCTGKIYSALLFIDGTGHALANYRRVHLAEDEFDAGLARGQWLTGLTLDQWAIGPMGGQDLRHPEQARALVLAGVELLLVAAAPQDDLRALRVLAPARALENGVPLVLVGWSTEEEGPAAFIFDAHGELLSQGTAASPAFAVLSRAARPARTLAQRRPRLYHRLVVAEGADAPRPD